ncbi:sulfotransferase [Shewanella sp. TC10]|uniref:sulfotransferase n=1 Tax=Shewanella sp. TC10 TaxID=1419739 RepID=UPI00129E73FC|nr:sulfotransferase [Shewanella sp. TC10]
MYSFFIDVDTNNNVVLNTASVGTLTEPVLSIAGRMISTGLIKSINVYHLLDNSVLDSNIKLTEAKNLTQQLSLSAEMNPYRFDIELSQRDLVEDLHFVVKAEIETVDGDNVEETIATGFIQSVELPEKVVFVVGSPRSGTSALGKACRKALKANAHGESHAIQGFNLLLETADSFFQQSRTANIKGNLVNAIPKTLMLAEQLNVLRKLYRLYYGDLVHLDKTPGIPMLAGLPLAIIAWPNAKVIFCKRRGMENIQSRLIKFPKVKFEQHAKQWRQSFVVWRKTKQKITQSLKHTQWFIEVDQFNMACMPESVANEVTALVDLKPRQHNILFKQLASDDKPEQTSKSASRSKSLADFGWTDAQVLQFKDVCSKEMKLQNYSFDEKYFLESQSVKEIT